MYGPESKCEKLNQRSKGEGGRGGKEELGERSAPS